MFKTVLKIMEFCPIGYCFLLVHKLLQQGFALSRSIPFHIGVWGRGGMGGCEANDGRHLPASFLHEPSDEKQNIFLPYITCCILFQ